MLYFEDEHEFDRGMRIAANVLIKKGILLESNFPYAYYMQDGEAFQDVRDWLINHGYNIKVDSQGLFYPGAGAVYGLYDEDKITLSKMLEELKKEAQKQATQF